ncbi:MAG: hypothetical protein EXR27_06720 [Betaproteobacteria bacterium]|nr:hypothetical protein [Betaproteobacteria bacterium]
MSWIDKELRRRQKAEAKRSGANSKKKADTTPETESAKIAALWEQFERKNGDLPPELRLVRQTASEIKFSPERSIFQVLLLAENASGIGFTGDALRYFWPKMNANKSNNFWIRWQPERGYYLSRRIKLTWSGLSTEERPFNEASLDSIFKCMVTGKLVKYQLLRKRGFWHF